MQEIALATTTRNNNNEWVHIIASSDKPQQALAQALTSPFESRAGNARAMLHSQQHHRGY